MEEAIKEQILFVLEDDNELMTAALDSDLDDENKRMNRSLIARHQAIIAKVEKGEDLTWDELLLVEDANEIHVNDTANVAEHHRQALLLQEWLKRETRRTIGEAVRALEKQLDSDPKTPREAYRALHILWEEATAPEQKAMEKAFSEHGKCLKCGSKVSLADVTDTLVFVGDEIVKRHDGDITNRNCVRCTYPGLYPEYREHDEAEGSCGGGGMTGRRLANRSERSGTPQECV